MKLIRPDNANVVITGEDGSPVHAYYEDGICCTAWELDERERELIANGGYILLAVRVGDPTGFHQPATLVVQEAEVT